jgi:hypothetical protein
VRRSGSRGLKIEATSDVALGRDALLPAVPHVQAGLLPDTGPPVLRYAAGVLTSVRPATRKHSSSNVLFMRSTKPLVRGLRIRVVRCSMPSIADSSS